MNALVLQMVIWVVLGMKNMDKAAASGYEGEGVHSSPSPGRYH
jgi:hypothetical protein